LEVYLDGLLRARRLEKGRQLFWQKSAPPDKILATPMAEVSALLPTIAMMNYYVGGLAVHDVTAEWAGAHCMMSSGHATSRDSRPHIAVVEPDANSGRSASRFSDVMTVKWPSNGTFWLFKLLRV